MRTLKFLLEKPFLIWLVSVIALFTVFWFQQVHRSGFDSIPEQIAGLQNEAERVQILTQFGESSFPPKIALVREVQDWGHLGFYAILGQLFRISGNDTHALRLVNLSVWALALLVFVFLGLRMIYHNRLNPLWVSLALLILAANPLGWLAAVHLHYLPLFLLFVFLGMYFFEKDLVGLAAFFISLGVLVDFRALLVAASFVATRALSNQSRLLRFDRVIAYLVPFVVGALPLLAWEGFVPQGQATDWFEKVKETHKWVHVDAFFYVLALLALFVPWYSWAWALRARARALVIGGIWTGILVPVYFLFPLKGDFLSGVLGRADAPLGFIDAFAGNLAGPYKTLVLFLPWAAGAYFFVQLVLMDTLDRSRWLKYYLILLFVAQLFVFETGDLHMLFAVPAVLLLSLAEGLVGDEGKIV